jgi:hypothetical protein
LDKSYLLATQIHTQHICSYIYLVYRIIANGNK